MAGFIFVICVAAVNLVAIRSIIIKAGYSSAWILVPIMPVVLIGATGIEEWIDLRSIVSGTSFFVHTNFETLKILSGLSALSIFVSWVFFLIFAFSRWPASHAQRPPATRPTPPRDLIIPVSVGGPSRMTPLADPPRTPYVQPGTGLYAPPPRDTVYCPWCAKPRAVDAHAIHHCGPLDRPHVYCETCGSALPEATGRCPACEAPASKVSHPHVPQA
jgi:hypothetical protein